MSEISDFVSVVLLQPGQKPTKNQTAHLTLMAFFQSLIKQEEIEIDVKQVERLFHEDLSINTHELDGRLVGVLSEAFVYYVMAWPGWKSCFEYNSGQLDVSLWYNKFRQYLIYKSNFIIKNASKFVKAAAINIKEQGTMTDISVPMTKNDRKTAPYVLNMKGPLSVLNNLVFMEHKGDVVIKQLKEKEWTNLSPNEILNWPHVGVEVKLYDTHFTRTNVHKSQRYISLNSNNEDSLIPDQNYISKVEKLNDASEDELVPYSYSVIFYYFTQLKYLLLTMSGIRLERRIELTAIIDEFIADIKAANIYNCTVCTKTSVTYQIGKCAYLRNKKMVKSAKDGPLINFDEIITPYMEYALHEFKVEQDTTTMDAITFKSLNKWEKIEKGTPNSRDIADFKYLINGPCITYTCTFCNVKFSGPKAYTNLTVHIEQKHKNEHALVCCICYEEYQVKDLARNRWWHSCKSKKKD